MTLSIAASTLAARCRAVRSDREGGRAIIEFIVLGLLLLVPIVYLIVTLALLQRASFAAATAAREAGRVFMTSDTDAQARERGQVAASLTFEDYGVARGTVTLACDGTPCLRPEGKVRAMARVVVSLPLVPDFLAGVIPASVPVEAVHEVTVDRFRSRGG